MGLELLQITPDNPLIITTEEGLEAIIGRVLNKLGFESQVPAAREIIQTEVTTRQAMKMLSQKGYRVSSSVAFKKVVSAYDIKPQPKGKDHWYQVADLERIPARK